MRNEGTDPDLLNEATFRLGKVYRRMGDLGKSAEFHEKGFNYLFTIGVVLPKYGAEAQYEAGLCLIGLSSEVADKKDAVEHLETLVKLWEGGDGRGLLLEFPDYEKNPEIKKLLEEKKKVIEEFKKQVGAP